MASEDDMTSDSLDVTVTDVPENLQEYVKTEVAKYITHSKDVSMKVHQVQGQSPKLVMIFGSNTGRGTRIPSRNVQTRTIFVRNIPESATEDLLEVFFESKKKYGGGPVKSVKIMKDMKAAFVEFCDASAVDEVLKKKPIMLGTTELDVKPFKPLLSGNDHITQADVKGINLPKDFTENLLRKHSEYCEPSYGPELSAKMKPGTRVVRGRDWCDGNRDGGGEGTVAHENCPDKGFVIVIWDNGNDGQYRIGMGNRYELKLAP